MEIDEPDYEIPPKPEYYAILTEKQKQLVGAYKPETLEGLCLSCIKRNSAFFVQLNQETNLNPFNCISNPMKSELLGDSLSKWGRWEELLVNKQVTSLKIETCQPTAYIKIWLYLSHENVQLRDLCWTGGVNHDSSENYKDLMLPEVFICGSLICANLQTLKLPSFVCTDLHLQMFASQLKKLRVLSLDLNGVTVNGISALSKLEHLEAFPFTRSPEGSEDATTAYNYCLQLMPKLQVVGEDWFDVENYDQFQDVDLKFHIDFQSIPTPAKLGLHQMLLHHQDGVIPEGITFPNLTCLRLWEPVENFRFDARYSKITDLGICFLGMEKYLRILNQIGHQLKKLLILENLENLLLDTLLRLCPNLEELSILECPRKIIFSSPLKPESDLQALKIFRVDFSNESGGDFSPGVLVQLLSAPKLKYVKLFWVDLTEEDAEAINSLVQQGRMLQKLEKFEAEINTGMLIQVENDDYYHSNEELRVRYDLVVLNMAKYCPCFVDYKDH